MNKFEKIIKKKHHLIVEESDVIGVLTILDDIKQNSEFHNNLKLEIGKCGCDMIDLWYIECEFAIDQWRKFIEILNDFDYELVLGANEYYYVKEKAERKEK